MKNLKIAPRLALAVLSCLVPLAIAINFYYDNVTSQIDFAVQEKLGDDYLRPVVKALNQVGEHYTLKLRTDAGDANAAAGLKGATDNLNKTFEEWKAIDAKIGADLQFTPEALKKSGRENAAFDSIAAKWQAIASSDPRSVKTDQYDALIADIRTVITHAGDKSNLILDPDLDSYYLMDTVLAALPNTLARIPESERYFYTLLTTHAGLRQDEAAKLETYAAMIEQDDLARVQGNMQTVYNEDPNFYGESPSLKGNTESKLADYAAASQAYTTTLHGMGAGSPAPGLGAILDQSSKARELAYAMWVNSVNELDVLLSKRIDHFAGDRMKNLTIFAVLLIVSFGFSWYVVNSIKGPLKKLQTAMIEIADGKLDYPVPCLNLKDEIGDMAKTLSLFKETSIEASRMEDEQRKEAQRKLERQKQVEDLIQHFDKKVSSLLFEVSHAADSMQGAVQSMEDTSRKTTDKSSATMAVTKETSNNVSAVAAAAEELSSAINEISRQVSRSASITQEAVNRTHDADGTVKQLAEAAQRIGEVVTLISGIAEQIDLLALNATIESARAGDAGKGFAVVATEVKNLASQTSKATDTIATQITEIQKVVGNVVGSLGKIRGTIDEVNGIASTIAAAVEEQGAATKEIAMNIQRTSDRVQEVANNVTEVGNMAIATNDNATNVMTSVRSFTGQSKTLQQEIEGFLGSIAKA